MNAYRNAPAAAVQHAMPERRDRYIADDAPTKPWWFASSGYVDADLTALPIPAGSTASYLLEYSQGRARAVYSPDGTRLGTILYADGARVR